MPAPRKDYSEAIAMYEKGLSIGQVAEIYKISRQAMYSALLLRNVVFRSNLKYGSENIFYRGGVRQCFRSRQLLSLAVEKGVVVPPKECSECGAPGRVEGHHDDYNKPIEVRWLCHKCHYEWHKENIPIENPCPEPVKTRKEICAMGGRAKRKKK